MKILTVTALCMFTHQNFQGAALSPQHFLTFLPKFLVKFLPELISIYRQSPIVLLLTNSIFKLSTLKYDTFSILIQPATISVTVFSNLTKID